MTLKELEYALDNYFHHNMFNAAVEHRNDLINQFDELFDTLSGVQYSDMPHNPNPQDGVLNTICRVDEKAEHLKRRIDKMQKRIDDIMALDEELEDTLPLLEPDEYEIIAMRHGQSREMSFTDIGRKLHYSERWIKDKYYNALHQLINLIEKSVQKPSKVI